jgi:hypothetical protein
VAGTERRTLRAGQSPAGPVGLQDTSDDSLQLDPDGGRSDGVVTETWAGGSARGPERTELDRQLRWKTNCRLFVYYRLPKMSGPKLGVRLKVLCRRVLLRYGLSQRTQFFF